METLAEKVIKYDRDITPDWYRRNGIVWRDWKCFFFGHKWKYLSDIMGNFRGDWVCRRCYRYRGNTNHDNGFYHNWEMNHGKFSRCHDHSKQLL